LPIIDSILEGYNNTLFAYGQTGSGKTYTIQGNDITSGIITRIIDNLFENINNSNKEWNIKCSYFELYNNNFYDLLGNKNNYKIIEDDIKGVFIFNMSEKVVKSSIEC